MKQQKTNRRRPAGVSLALAIWAVFFGIVIILNVKTFPEPFSASRAAAVGIAAVGLFVLLAFARGKKWARSTFLSLGLIGCAITLWAILLGWLRHQPIPVGVLAALAAALISVLLVVSRSARRYCAPPAIRELTSTVLVRQPGAVRSAAAGVSPAPGPRRKRWLFLIPVVLLLGAALFYLWGEMRGGGSAALEDEALLSTLQQAGNRVNRPASSPTLADDLRQGIEFYEKKAWAQAVPLLWRASRADPGNAEVFFYLGESLGSLKGMAEEEQYVRTAIGLSPFQWRFHGIYGSSSYFVRQDARAQREYRILRELDPARGAEYQTWLQTNKRREPIIVQGRFYIKQAAYFFRKLLPTVPTRPDLEDAAYRLGLRKVTGADVLMYLTAIGADSRDARAHFMLGYLYYRRGEMGKSISYFQKAESLGFTDRALYYWLGLAYLEKGDPWQALIHYEYLKKGRNPLAADLFARLYPV